MSVDSESDLRVRPYPPSWLNYLSGWVQQLPGPSWAYYLGLWLALVVIQVAVVWIERIFAVGTLFPAQFFIPAMLVLMLGMVHYLDRRASAALETLRPVLTLDERGYDLGRYRLITLPAVPTLLASVVTIGTVLLLGLISGEIESSIEAVASSPVAHGFLLAVYWIGWWIVGAFIYHTIHQLREISRIYTKHTRVHLFAQRPLYAFSSVTALTAGVLALAAYGWTALNPDNLTRLYSMAAVVLITILALAAFAWPLLGARRLLYREKAQRLDAVSLRVEAVFDEIHQCVDSEESEKLDELTKILSVLESERNTLDGISTWPWQPDTLRYLATALLLPLLLWIIQYVVQLITGS